jgi:hypothetical protein
MRSVSEEPGQSQEYSCIRSILYPQIQLQGLNEDRLQLYGPVTVNGPG